MTENKMDVFHPSSILKLQGLLGMVTERVMAGTSWLKNGDFPYREILASLFDCLLFQQSQ